MSTKLLVDADMIAMRAAFAAEKSKYLVIAPAGAYPYSEEFDDAKAAKEAAFSRDGLVWSRKELQPVEQALLIADILLKDVRERYAAENPSISLFLSGSTNFRDSVARRTRYKGSRTGAVPPTHIKAVRGHLITRGAAVSDMEEADDVIARHAGSGTVIVSQDKDFNQIPGRIYNFTTKEEVVISPKQAVLNFYSQVLSGDPVDSIPGLTGVGPVKAAKALALCKNPVECWQVALALYSAEFGPEKGPEYALECARLVKIGQPKGVLWTPPSTRRIEDSIVETKKAASLGSKKTSGSRGVSVRAGKVDSGRSDSQGSQV
jgi:hypothetical protein